MTIFPIGKIGIFIFKNYYISEKENQKRELELLKNNITALKSSFKGVV